MRSLEYFVPKLQKALSLTGPETPELMMPHVILDIAYLYYQEYVKKLPLRLDCKKYRRQWAESYKKYNDMLRAELTIDEQDEFSDILDAFTKFIYADAIAFHAKCLRSELGVGREHNQTMAAMLLINRICQIAEAWFRRICSAADGTGLRCSALCGLVTYSKAMGGAYLKQNGINTYISESDFAKFEDAVYEWAQKALKFKSYMRNINTTGETC